MNAYDLIYAVRSAQYDTTFKLGDLAIESVHKKTFAFTDSTTLLVTNTLDGSLPLGNDTQSMEIRTVVLTAVSVIPMIGMLWYWRKRKKTD